ncbi:MAG: L-fucose/L-arabinose isomerase family protein [Spirochaetales bacterium]|nr:L-fucose/L-arabinose isomerase family protein [Spirochaetales bacterium]
METRVGLFGIGLDTYWDQFEGLQERLTNYLNDIEDKISSYKVTVINAGLVDNPEGAKEKADYFRQEKVEAIFLYVSTYALSHTVLPIVQELKVPVIVLNLQPVAAIDYEKFNALGDRGVMTGEWLAHCQACSIPELACVFNQAGIDYSIVTGYMTEEYAWDKIRIWTESIKVRSLLKSTRFGILGHYYGGMLDVYTDVTGLSSVFGCHFEILEMDELNRLRKEVTEEEISRKIDEFNKEFSVSDECEKAELIRAAHTSCALDALVKTKDLGAMAYYYEGSPGNDHENIITSVIAGNTLLTSNHIPVAGECEVKNSVAMKIMDLFNAGGSFSEFYAMDFNDDIVMWGHDGPAHMGMADGPVGLVPLSVYHGKPGKGLSIQMSVLKGLVTLLSVVQGAEGKTSLLVAEGESVEGPVLMIGNTNSRYKFPVSARDFTEQWSYAGPSHHCAIGKGHIAEELKCLAKLLNIDCIQVC